MKTKIEWCDYTWNPVWGCLNTCEYCYARKINARFKKINEYFKPEWMEKNFSKNFRTNKKQRIFVNSMSDVSHWKHEWIIKVLDKIKQHPVHTFIFLTKNPTIYPRYNFPENCLLGITVTNAYDLHTRTARKQWIKNNKSFVSIEPMHGPIVDTAELQDFNWVILGAETGNRKNKIVPAKQWIDIIVAYCLSTNTPLFMKENIIKHYDGKKYTQYGENI